ncbi:MAG: sigma-70 family RNA polymerase sigma factor [Candidatus Hydrogenedentes bacterium]|nr:sigma-70 family RNA polymerase sigma factor [Candidatus Hydrogenedentota bacterium]
MNQADSHNQKAPDSGTSPVVDPGEWVDAHGDVLYRYALARVQRPDVAEDLVQETFLAALKCKDRFQGRSSERTWLTGILRHKILDYYRSRSRGLPETDQVSHEDWLGDFFDENGSWNKPPDPHAIHPESLVERKEFWEVFDSCLDELPVRARDAFVRRVVEDEDIDMICKTLEVTATNLYVILFRARTQMRHCLTLKWFQAQEMRPPS